MPELLVEIMWLVLNTCFLCEKLALLYTLSRQCPKRSPHQGVTLKSLIGSRIYKSSIMLSHIFFKEIFASCATSSGEDL
jgi:hypothetical protein